MTDLIRFLCSYQELPNWAAIAVAAHWEHGWLDSLRVRNQTQALCERTVGIFCQALIQAELADGHAALSKAIGFRPNQKTRPRVRRTVTFQQSRHHDHAVL